MNGFKSVMKSHMHEKNFLNILKNRGFSEGKFQILVKFIEILWLTTS